MYARSVSKRILPADEQRRQRKATLFHLLDARLPPASAIRSKLPPPPSHQPAAAVVDEQLQPALTAPSNSPSPAPNEQPADNVKLPPQLASSPAVNPQPGSPDPMVAAVQKTAVSARADGADVNRRVKSRRGDRYLPSLEIRVNACGIASPDVRFSVGTAAAPEPFAEAASLETRLAKPLALICDSSRIAPASPPVEAKPELTSSSASIVSGDISLPVTVIESAAAVPITRAAAVAAPTSQTKPQGTWKALVLDDSFRTHAIYLLIAFGPALVATIYLARTNREAVVPRVAVVEQPAPRATEQARAIEQPRAAQQPRAAEQPRATEHPPAADQPPAAQQALAAPREGALRQRAPNRIVEWQAPGPADRSLANLPAVYVDPPPAGANFQAELHTATAAQPAWQPPNEAQAVPQPAVVPHVVWQPAEVSRPPATQEHSPGLRLPAESVKPRPEYAPEAANQTPAAVVTTPAAGTNQAAHRQQLWTERQTRFGPWIR